MLDGETENHHDSSEEFAAEVARCRRTIADAISDVRSIRERHPKVRDDLFNVIGMLQEADELLQDIPDSYSPGEA